MKKEIFWILEVEVPSKYKTLNDTWAECSIFYYLTSNDDWSKSFKKAHRFQSNKDAVIIAKKKLQLFQNERRKYFTFTIRKIEQKVEKIVK